METSVIKKIAQHIHSARLQAREITKITEEYPDLGVPEAYLVQNEGIRLREAEGEKVVSLKMGLTSAAKREQMGLSSPVYGTLTDRMQLPANDTLSLQGSLHPKAEPEIAFKIQKDIRGSLSRDEVLEACCEVYPAIEILDSRFVGFKYFSLEDVIADNSSSYRFVLGEPLRDFRELDFENLEMKLKVNNEVIQSASSSAISGNPLQSVVQLAELLDREGRFIPAGCVVLAGAATPAAPLASGQSVAVEVDQIGAVQFSVSE